VVFSILCYNFRVLFDLSDYRFLVISHLAHHKDYLGTLALATLASALPKGVSVLNKAN
jgi:hypothetical protein